MSLEHRWSARRSVHFDAVIFHRPLGLVRSKVLAVSLEGVRAHTGRFSLPENASVELTFALALHAADKPPTSRKSIRWKPSWCIVEAANMA